MTTTNDPENDQPVEPRAAESRAETPRAAGATEPMAPPPTWARTPGVEPVAHGTAPAGAPAEQQPWGAWTTTARTGPRPRWQLPVGIGVGALIIVAGAGFGGFAIGHALGGGSGSTQQTVPNGQFPGGAPTGFPGGSGGTGGSGGFGGPNGSGTGSGSSGTGTGTGTGTGSGSSGTGTGSSGTSS